MVSYETAALLVPPQGAGQTPCLCLWRVFIVWVSQPQTGEIAVNEILTYYDPPPIPVRQFDWHAYRVGYEGGDPLGFGPTRELAIADLLGIEQERE